MKKILLLLLLLPCFSEANDISVSDVKLVNQDAVNNMVSVQFDLSWSNSWRVSSGPSNYDAAWIFVKYRVDGTNWAHANMQYINGTTDGHIAPAGVSIKTADSGVGCMIHRSSNGSGDVNWQNIELKWNYPLLIDDDAYIEIKVFALEMVYVPQSSFYLGAGNGTEVNKLYQYPTISSSFLVSSENAINVGTTNGHLYYENSLGNGGDRLGPIPTDFPKGYSPFYCMKYEFTQGQFVDFFNTLTATQKANNDITGPDGKNTDALQYGNTISWDEGSSLATTTTPDRPCNYLKTTFELAYMDWAGLRPMTELEYIKACRGPNTPVSGEFAWGSTNIHGVAYILNNSDSPSESISNMGVGTGNVSYSTSDGAINRPLRVGIFASSAANKNRQETGATYYGIMEMSGNMYERAVTIGSPRGRLFSGNHGNGIISSQGLSTVTNWPLTSGDGFGFLGASYLNSSEYLRIADRNDAANIINSGNSRLGFRAVRAL